jgi:hypothetical protein
MQILCPQCRNPIEVVTLTAREEIGCPSCGSQFRLETQSRPPRSLNDHIPRDLETICLKAMAKEPSRRYGTAADLADHLRRWRNGEAIKTRPVGRMERLIRWSKRHPAAALVAVSGVAALALVGFGVGLFYSAWLKEAFQEEEEQRKKAVAAQKGGRRTAPCCRVRPPPRRPNRLRSEQPARASTRPRGGPLSPAYRRASLPRRVKR